MARGAYTRVFWGNTFKLMGKGFVMPTFIRIRRHSSMDANRRLHSEAPARVVVGATGIFQQLVRVPCAKLTVFLLWIAASSTTHERAFRPRGRRLMPDSTIYRWIMEARRKKDMLLTMRSLASR